MKRLFLIFLTLSLFMWARGAFGTIYYTRGDGTQTDKTLCTGGCNAAGGAAAFLTEGAIFSETFSALDEIHFCDNGGTFTQIQFQRSGTTDYITLKNAPGHTPIIDGGGTETYLLQLYGSGLNYVKIDGLNFKDNDGADAGHKGHIDSSSIKHHIIIQNCTFSQTEDHANSNFGMIKLYDVHDVLIYNNTFTGKGMGIRVSSNSDGNNYEVYNLEISYNQFNSLSSSSGGTAKGMLLLPASTAGASPGVFHDINIHHNTAAWVTGQFVFLQGQDIFIQGGFDHYNIKINDNGPLDRVESYCIDIAGMSDVGGTKSWNEVQRNVITYSGYDFDYNPTTLDDNRNNAINVHHISQTLIANNIVGPVDCNHPTDSGDCCGIMLDYHKAVDTTEYFTEDNIVANNEIFGYNGNPYAAGISYFRAVDNIIFGNILRDGNWGIKMNNDNISGNLTANNVIDGNSVGANITNVVTDDNPFINNMFTNNTDIGMKIDAASRMPTQTYNLWYNNTNGNIIKNGVSQALGAGSISGQDPKYENATSNVFRLTARSPAINTGSTPPWLGWLDGSGQDLYDADGDMVWSDTIDAVVGPWLTGIDMGADGYYSIYGPIGR